MTTSMDTARTWIRSFQASDWTDLFDYLSLPETYRFEPGDPITVDEAKDLATERAQSNTFLAVVRKEDRKMIGHLYIQQIQPKELLTWELGYIFHPLVHSRGFCTEACARILAYVFDDFHAHRITASCNPLNPASWRVLEKIGMKREGHLRKNLFFRTGTNGNPLWQDTFVYAILKEDRCICNGGDRR